MTIINRHITYNVLPAICVVLLILIILIASITLLTQIESLRHNYQILQAFNYILMSIPNMFMQIFPISILIGCIIGLGSLANNNELIILRSAGLSIMQICFPIIKLLLVLIVFFLLIGEFIAPKLQIMADEQKLLARSSTNNLINKEGIWWREKNQYIYIQNINKNKLLNISIIEFNKYKIKKIIYAKKALKADKSWMLFDVTQIKYHEKGQTKKTLKTKIWSVDLDAKIIKIATSLPKSLSIYDLYKIINYLDQQNLDTKKYKLAFYSKIFAPISIIALMLVGISFVFGYIRFISMGYRLLTGISTGIIFMLIQNIAGHASIIVNISPVFAVLCPIISCLLIAYYLLHRRA